MISLTEAKEFGRLGNVIPVFEKIPADLDTPVSAFIKLATHKKQCFLLESIEGGEKLARYSFLGFDPFMIIESDGVVVTTVSGRKKVKVRVSPLEFIKELFQKFKPVSVKDLPRFTGGAVGYFAYDAIRWVETLQDTRSDDVGLPVMRLSLYSRIIAFDHLKQEIALIANLLTGNKVTIEKQYRDASKWIIDTKRKLSRPLTYKTVIKKSNKPIQFVADTTQTEFESNVRKAKEHIREGNVYQVVLSQRWQVKSPNSALDVYRRLRRINPSPYMFLLNYGKDAVVGASPEMMVRIEKGVIETRPIAGTRPRGENEAADERLIKELFSDKKELSEHTMLLDLGRNDIGRVSKTGTVKVKENMIVEKYSHVIHIVSSVTGRMNSNVQPIDGHFACFPAGTVTGAPKIRAMQLIDELESHKRGVYAGSIAYLDFWGNLDSCIAIRTVVKKGNTYFVQAGAGIVADSDPTREYNETKSKALAAMQAVMGK
jgi:anthranilate synthase component 1